MTDIDLRLILFKRPTIIINSISYFRNQALAHHSITNTNTVNCIFKRTLLFLTVHTQNNKYRKDLLSWTFDKTTKWAFILSQLENCNIPSVANNLHLYISKFIVYNFILFVSLF